MQSCQISDLYWQFQAEWSVLKPVHEQIGSELPSYSTFSAVGTPKWSHMLRVRANSQHQQCNICFDLQQVLKGPRTPWSKKLEVAKALREHQTGQHADRVLYWSLRHASQMQAKPVSQSRSPQSTSVLTIIIDDMDHSKFAWPRGPFRKQPHELDNLIRPTVTLTGALAHGWGTLLYMAAPQVPGGSDYFLEVLPDN